MYVISSNHLIIGNVLCPFWLRKKIEVGFGGVCVWYLGVTGEFSELFVLYTFLLGCGSPGVCSELFILYTFLLGCWSLEITFFFTHLLSGDLICKFVYCLIVSVLVSVEIHNLLIVSIVAVTISTMSNSLFFLCFFYYQGFGCQRPTRNTVLSFREAFERKLLT